MSEKSSNNNANIEDIRREYVWEELLEENVYENPIDQFKVWFDHALLSDIPDPNAMSLATATKEGKPSVRIVLLKGFDKEGFRFFSNYKSRKGRELKENPNASLCLFWSELERQVRLEGTVRTMSRNESETYFRKRPLLSQLGALASNQSEEVKSREKLEQRFEELKEKYKDEPIPMPESWGGYRLKPSSVEFWQGRRGRLHDRLLYEYVSGSWVVKRLSP